MEELQSGSMELKFAEMIWESAPVASGDIP